MMATCVIINNKIRSLNEIVNSLSKITPERFKIGDYVLAAPKRDLRRWRFIRISSLEYDGNGGYSIEDNSSASSNDINFKYATHINDEEAGVIIEEDNKHKGFYASYDEEMLTYKVIFNVENNNGTMARIRTIEEIVNSIKQITPLEFNYFDYVIAFKDKCLDKWVIIEMLVEPIEGTNKYYGGSYETGVLRFEYAARISRQEGNMIITEGRRHKGFFTEYCEGTNRYKVHFIDESFLNK